MKQMTPKNLCKWTLTMAMVVIFCAFCVMMAAQSVSGTCGDQVEWSLENGVLTISGSGPMEDYEYKTVPWDAKRDSIRKIVIEEGVTEISRRAFLNLTMVEEVVISDTVTKICDTAFFGCDKLTEVRIPDGVTEIGRQAFVNCFSLKRIAFGKNVKSIAEEAVCYCDELSSITVDEQNAYFKVIDNCLIETASGKLLVGADNSKIPDEGSVKTIAKSAFAGNGGSGDIIIPEGVVVIGEDAFASCDSMRSLTISKTVESIENSFMGSIGLETISVAEGNTNFYTESGCLIRREDNSIVICAKDAEIPAGVKASGKWDSPGSEWSLVDGVLTVRGNPTAYSHWRWLNLHNHIRKVVLEYGVSRICERQFEGCKNLTEVVIPESLIVIYANAFNGCASLKEITLGTGVRSIDENAFANCTSLLRVTAPADSSFFRNEGNRLVEISTGKTVFEPLPLPASQPPVVSQSASVSQPAADSQPETVSQNTSSEPSAGKISWSVENGVLTVWGSGPIPDYDTQEAPWSAHRLEIKKVIIEDGITVIGKRAFAEISVATEVSIANTVTTIKQSAFYWCRSLTEIVIPDSVTDIHQGAFNACYDLRSVVIGAGLRSSLFTIFPLQVKNITVHPDNKVYRSENNCIIWREDNRLCFRADDAVVPDGVTIGYSNENGSWELQDGTLTVSVQGSTQKLGLSWEAVNLDEVIYKVVLKEGVTAVDSRNFRDCKNLMEVILPDSLTEIGSRAFYYCSSLREVTIPDSVTVIGDAAFSLCEMLQRVTIGAGVEEIAANAFYDCNALKEIVVHPDNKIYHVENGCLFKTATREIVATTVDAQLPSGAALEGTSGFVKWNISDGVLTISGSGPMQDYYSANDAPWSKQQKNIIKAVVEDGVSSIGVNAFNHFVNMTELVIGADVTKIEKSAFTNCYALSKITVDENNKVYRDEDNCLIVRHSGQVLVVGADTEPPSAGGGYCGGKVTWSLENGVLTISGSGDMYGYDFSNAPWYLMREKIYSVVVENGVTNVGGGSFSGCVNLKSVRLADSVEEIETYVFENCTRLESIHISEGIVKIRHGAFTNCSSLTEIVLPDSLQVLYPYVFEGCVQLSQMTVPDLVTEIGEGLFKDCFNLKKLNIGAGVAKIDKTAFSGCDSLKKVTVEPDNEIYLSEGNCVLERTDNRLVFSAQGAAMPKSIRLEGSYGADFTWTLQNGVLTISGTGTLQKSEQQEAPWQEWQSLIVKVVLEEGVTRIGTHTFAEYPALKEVVFPRSLIELEDFAFWRCDALTEVTFKGTYSRWKTIDVGKNTPIEQADVFGVISAHIWLVAVVVLVPAAVIICLKRRKD